MTGDTVHVGLEGRGLAAEPVLSLGGRGGWEGGREGGRSLAHLMSVTKGMSCSIAIRLVM